MATESIVNRTDDPAAGDDFATFTKTSGARTQAFNEDLEVSATQLLRNSTAAAAITNVLVKASAAKLFQLDVLLTTPFPADRWLMAFDKAIAPVNGDVPVFRARISGGFASADFGKLGIDLSLGLAVAVSATLGTLTLPGAGEAYFQAGYL